MTAATTTIAEIDRVTKRYRTITALDAHQFGEPERRGHLAYPLRGAEAQVLAQQRAIDITLVGLDRRVGCEGHRREGGDTGLHDRSLSPGAALAGPTPERGAQPPVPAAYILKARHQAARASHDQSASQPRRAAPT
jgi:hypothetical protein